jgi:hypothetical protein
MKFRAGSEVPAGAVIYPSLGSSAQHPDLSQEIETLSKHETSRRLTFGGETPNHPRSFSFESGKPVNFGSSIPLPLFSFHFTDLLRPYFVWHDPHGS